MLKHLPKLLAFSAFVITLGSPGSASAETRGQHLEDAAITARVKAALFFHSDIKATRVIVKTRKGAVRLSGDVDSRNQQSEAVHAARQVAGVKSVNDNLTVEQKSEH
ncbi:MAG: BON domain-containing protein [Bdellovibrionales bacterium]